MFLTEEQRDRLKDVSSPPDVDISRMTFKDSRIANERIDDVLIKLHYEAPHAFHTRPRISFSDEGHTRFEDRQDSLSKRCFYHAPNSSTPFLSAVTYEGIK